MLSREMSRSAMLLLLVAASAAAAPAAAAPAAALPPTLIDHPIASGTAPRYLDGNWTATNPLWATLNTKVPGDIISDLQAAGRVGDPYWNTTWREPAFVEQWNNGTWTYIKTFATPATAAVAADSATLTTSANGATLLVFDGIRMGAVLRLNGQWLGNATDQFLRYEFAVTAALAPPGGRNTLSVAFDKSIATGGRFCYSSQIDWAPNFVTFDPSPGANVPDAQKIVGRETFGFGIWKSVYLLPVPHGGAAITQVRFLKQFLE